MEVEGEDAREKVNMRSCGAVASAGGHATVHAPHLEEVERLVGRVHLQVEFPRAAGVAVHHVAPGQPTDVDVLALVPLVVDEQQGLLGRLVVARGGQRDAVVVVEVVVVVHVGLRSHGEKQGSGGVRGPTRDTVSRHALAP